jgi:hypothetical protein
LDKKGMMETIVKAIPVIIIGAILLGVVLVSIFVFTKSSVDREACRDSVLLKARSKVLGNTLFDQLQCETDNVKVKATAEDEIYTELAGEMYDCWYQFGEGKVDFLDDYDAWQGDRWCFVCSKLTFDEDVVEDVDGVSVDNFNDFMATKTIPLKKEQTFHNYIYGDVENPNLPNSGDEWDTENPVYVVFYADKSREFNAAFWTEAGVGAAGVVVCGVSAVAAYFTAGFSAIFTSGLASFACARGAIAVGTMVTMMVSVKEGYTAGLQVGDSQDSIAKCLQ